MIKNILIIEDKSSQLRLAEPLLQYKLHFHSLSSDAGLSGLAKMWSMSPQPDVVLVDMVAGGQHLLKVIREIKAHKLHWPVIALTQYGNDELATQAITSGASDYVTKPVSIERLNLTIRNVLKMKNMGEAIARLERHGSGHVSFSDIVGNSNEIKRALAQAEMLSVSNMPIWIEGEVGTGKELFARAIHGSSAVAGESFVEIDCAALADTTMEAFVFGERKVVDSLQFFINKMREADRGTLYLKNIMALSPSLQHCFFDLLETGRLPVTPEFGHIPVHFRVIIGSDTSLDDVVMTHNSGPLLKKLYGMVITLPALRNRREDIASLSKHFVAMHAASENKIITNITADAIKLLESNLWPGNVIQLSRTLERAVLLCNHSELDSGTLRLILQLEPVHYSGNDNDVVALAPTLVDVRGQIKKLKSIEEEVIRFALVHSGGSMTRAARNLGIGRSTLYRKLGEMEPEIYSSRENQMMRPRMVVSSTDRS